LLLSNYRATVSQPKSITTKTKIGKPPARVALGVTT
jgi:hypothetical protein